MQRSYQLLSITLGIGFLALFLLQSTTQVFRSAPAASAVAHAPVVRGITPRPQATPPIKTTTTTTVITGGQGGINRVPNPSEDPTTCGSGIASTPADVLKLLAPGWTLQDLGEQYRNETKRTLCYDGFKSEWAVPGGTWLPTSDFLTTMHWPSDLFTPSVSQILIVQRPNDVLKPSNATTSQNT